jgi:hypothetical protein
LVDERLLVSKKGSKILPFISDSILDHPVLRSSKALRINNVIKETLRQIESENEFSPQAEILGKQAAIGALTDAASAGGMIKNIRKVIPDVIVNKKTILHPFAGPFGTPALTHSTQTIDSTRNAPVVTTTHSGP